MACHLWDSYSLQLASGSTVLDDSPESVSKLVLKELTNLGVKIEFQAKVTVSQLPGGQNELKMSSGRKLAVDMYIPAFGLVPNSSYVPSEYLNANGYVMVDNYLQLSGAGPVWAIGDVCATEGSQYLPANNQATHAVKNILLTLNGQKMLPYKAWTIGKRSISILSVPVADILTAPKGLQIGKKAGTGHVGNWKLPSFLVVFMRKTLFTDRLASTVNGSMF
jgi:apoptosis-inducing factor 2